MTDAPLISCIVPAYNSERFVTEALDSIVAQTYRPLEIICCDDGSTDGTAAIVSGYGADVRHLRQPTAGPAATRNLGVRAARGAFIAFLDADDRWYPDKLARQVARFAARPELEVSVTHAELFWADEVERARYRTHARSRSLPGYATTTMLARCDIFARVGPFNSALWFSDATEWFLRAAECGVVVEMLPEVLTAHRMHGSNLTRRRDADSRAEFLRIVKQALDRRRGRASGSPHA